MSFKTLAFVLLLAVLIAPAWFLASTRNHAAATAPAKSMPSAPPPKVDASPAIVATDAWARWLPENLPCAGYLTLRNTGKVDALLSGADSPDFARVMIHESYATSQGAEKMRRVASLALPAGGAVQFQPGGYHLMLMEPRRALTPGETVTVVLHFTGQPDLAVTLPLKPPGALQ